MSNLIDVTANFDEFIKDGITVVDFWATWCGPCKMLSPVIDEVSANFPSVRFGKVDVDNAMDLARRYNVSSIPNVCLFKDGQLADRIIGLCDYDELCEFVSKNLK